MYFNGISFYNKMGDKSCLKKDYKQGIVWYKKAVAKINEKNEKKWGFIYKNLSEAYAYEKDCKNAIKEYDKYNKITGEKGYKSEFLKPCTANKTQKTQPKKAEETKTTAKKPQNTKPATQKTSSTPQKTVTKQVQKPAQKNVQKAPVKTAPSNTTTAKTAPLPTKTTSTNPNSPDMIDVYVKEGDSLFNKGNYSGALAKYKLAENLSLIYYGPYFDTTSKIQAKIRKCQN